MQRRTDNNKPLSIQNLKATIEQIVQDTPIDDIHTHLYDPAFGRLLYWGIDELLVYHYLIAESFRYHRMDYTTFWSLSKTEQADLIWDQLFIENSPISESCHGVVTCLHLLGIDFKKRDLPAIRKHFKQWSTEKYVDHIFQIANVDRVTMTNNPFDVMEQPLWQKGWKRDRRFEAALRLDEILVTWEQAVPRLRQWGYDVSPDTNQRTLDEVRRFLHEWIMRMKPAYMMVSVPHDFTFPDAFTQSPHIARSRLIANAVLPECREHGLPLALMIGVKRLANPHLKLAGDFLGRGDVSVVEQMCAMWPENRFLITMLSRENQHELCVLARKFHNLHIFGCWWFLNNPSIIDEITRERIELLGWSFTAQHSDARVLDQLLYKWDHFRKILSTILVEKYSNLLKEDWVLTKNQVQRDIQNLLGGSFRSFLTSN